MSHIAYLDTNVVLYLILGDTKRLTKRAMQAIERHELLVSPMVALELTYLREIGRLTASAEIILGELYSSIDLRVCTIPFDRIVRTASKESWTRDTYDRLIVSNAKANNESPLITSDEVIARHYPQTVW